MPNNYVDDTFGWEHMDWFSLSFDVISDRRHGALLATLPLSAVQLIADLIIATNNDSS